jgi:hypothetical protein
VIGLDYQQSEEYRMAQLRYSALIRASSKRGREATMAGDLNGRERQRRRLAGLQARAARELCRLYRT